MDSTYTVVRGEGPDVPINDYGTSESRTNKAVGDQQRCRVIWIPTHSITLINQISPPKRHTRDSKKYDLVTVVAADDSDDRDGYEKTEMQSTKILTGAERRDWLPPVDNALGTGLQCRLTIIFGIVCSLACIACSIGYWVTSHGPANIFIHSDLPGEAASFIVNLILTQCLEGLAYVHSVSLRWALLKENRLVFNTNIRLMTSSNRSRANSWYINAISAALLILCYAATSMLFIPRVDADYGTLYETHVNLLALLALGLALLGQTVLAIWCYYSNLRDIPTWSSDTLNTTVLMLDQQLVRHREGRCIESMQVRDILGEEQESAPKLPSPQQPSQWQLIPTARHALIFIWILAGLSFVWFLTIVLVARGNMIGAINQVEHLPNATWHFSMTWNATSNPVVESLGGTYFFNAVFFNLDWAQSIPDMPFVPALIANLLFVCAIQGLQTLGLHFSELIINLSRDEDVWRSLDAYGRSNAVKTSVLEKAPFLAALTSWKYIVLVIFKSLLHWLLGQSSQASVELLEDRVWLTMNYSRLFIYAICATTFALVITFIACMKPKGPQPATYGHIQTLADVIDDWNLDDDRRFWWGDKGCSGTDGVRHAGMSCNKDYLGEIQMKELYAG